MPPSDPTVHSGTVTAFFDTLDAANKAVDSLVAAGIPRADVSTTSGEGTGGPENEKGFWESLKELFLPEEDRYTYAEGLRRGGALVSVRANDADYERALEILDAEGAVNLDEREANWRSEGWEGYQSGVASDSGFGHSGESGLEPGARISSASAATASPAPTAAQTPTTPTGQEEAIPVYEEQLRVGKRDINHGRVRVRSYVVETPVSEQVNLRNESVQVERKPVDRPVGAGDAVFQDRIIEAEEHAEEAVVGKEARVKEVVTLKKTAKDRTQTVTDKVRSTKVDVEDERTSEDVETSHP